MLDHQKFIEFAAKHDGDEKRILDAMIASLDQPFAEGLIGRIAVSVGCDRKLVRSMFQRVRKLFDK